VTTLVLVMIITFDNTMRLLNISNTQHLTVLHAVTQHPAQQSTSPVSGIEALPTDKHVEVSHIVLHRIVKLVTRSSSCGHCWYYPAVIQRCWTVERDADDSVLHIASTVCACVCVWRRPATDHWHWPLCMERARPGLRRDYL